MCGQVPFTRSDSSRRNEAAGIPAVQPGAPPPVVAPTPAPVAPTPTPAPIVPPTPTPTANPVNATNLNRARARAGTIRSGSARGVTAPLADRNRGRKRLLGA